MVDLASLAGQLQSALARARLPFLLPQPAGMSGFSLPTGSHPAQYTHLAVWEEAIVNRPVRIPPERRSTRRQKQPRLINCHASGQPDLIQCSTLDLSVQGFFLLTDFHFPLLTRVVFEVFLVPDEPPFVGQGVVRWTNRQNPRGMGIEIVWVGEPERWAHAMRAPGQMSLVRRILSSLGRVIQGEGIAG